MTNDVMDADEMARILIARSPREQAHHHLDVAFPAGPGLPRCQMQLGRSLAANVVDISIYHQCIANVAFV